MMYIVMVLFLAIVVETHWVPSSANVCLSGLGNLIGLYH